MVVAIELGAHTLDGHPVAGAAAILWPRPTPETVRGLFWAAHGSPALTSHTRKRLRLPDAQPARACSSAPGALLAQLASPETTWRPSGAGLAWGA